MGSRSFSGVRAHVENSWQSSRARPALMLLVRSMGCNRAGPEDHGPRLAAPLDACVPVGRARMHASMHVCQYERACVCMWAAQRRRGQQHSRRCNTDLSSTGASAPARGDNPDPRTTRPCCSLPTAPRRTAQQERPGACRAFLAVQRRTIRARQRALVHHAPGSVCTIWGRPPAAPPRVVGGAPMRNKYERICQYALAYVGVVPARRQRASGQRAGAQGSSCTPAPHTLSPGRLVQCAREHGAAHAGLLGALVPCSHGVGGRR